VNKLFGTGTGMRNFAAFNSRMTMKDKRTGAFLLIFFLLLCLCFFVVVVPMIRNREAKKPVLPILGTNLNHHVQPFSLLNQDGQVVTEKDMAGKVCVVEFFFATCKGMCPKMNSNMALVYEKYRNNDRVLIMSHTVDPQKDSVAALKNYAGQFGAQTSHWMFLTGDKKKLYELARYSYLINADQDTAGVSIDKDFIHDKHFVLVDGMGRLRGFYDGLQAGDVARMTGDIGLLLDEKVRNE
jgi:protein SCO1